MTSYLSTAVAMDDNLLWIIYVSYTLEEILQPPYSHYMDPVSYDVTDIFRKMCLLVALFTHLLATGGDGHTCYLLTDFGEIFKI